MLLFESYNMTYMSIYLMLHRPGIEKKDKIEMEYGNSCVSCGLGIVHQT